MLRNRGSLEINRCLIIHSKPKKENQYWKFCCLMHWYITTGKRTFVDFVWVISLVRVVHCTVSVSVWCILYSKWPRFPAYQRVLFVKDRCFSVLQIVFCVLSYIFLLFKTVDILFLQCCSLWFFLVWKDCQFFPLGIACNCTFKRIHLYCSVLSQYESWLSVGLHCTHVGL